MRTKDHTRPKTDAALSWINDKEYNVVYLDPQCTDESTQENRVLYLTFDVGYENGNVENILDVLKQENVTAAFFILGSLVVKNTALVERMFNEGHLVCNHTAHHKNMSKINDSSIFNNELNVLSNAYTALTGKPIAKYYRPPEGTFSENNLKMAQDLGYKTVLWSFAYADWDNASQPSPEFAKKKILENVHDGAVILLHPTSATNAAILGDVIDEISAMGYEFGTLDEITK
jgi:peptidoglycan-N-acetylmuramic acid deacetylase